MKWRTPWLVLFLLYNSRLLAQVFPVEVILQNGGTDERINIVILGDGYQEPEMEKYIEVVNIYIDILFNTSPFKEYRNYWQYYLLSLKLVFTFTWAAWLLRKVL